MEPLGDAGLHFHDVERAPRLLVRVSHLLSFLGAHPGATLTETAATTGLPAATVSRLLNALLHLGWIDRRGGRGGWLIGPRLHALMDSVPYREHLIQAARDEMHHLSRRLQSEIKLVGVVRDRRQTLLIARPVRGPISPLDEDANFYSTPTGRVNLAYLPARHRARLLNRIGLPKSGDWPGVSNRPELLRELAAIRKNQGERIVLRRSDHDNWVAEAVPVADGEGATFALSNHRLQDSKDATDNRPALRKTARRIETAYAALVIRANGK